MNWALAAGSLAAVLTLAGIAWLLGLGGGGIDEEAEAMVAAEDAVSGFEAVSAIIADDRRSAIVRGRDGDTVQLMMKGARVVARHRPGA